MNSVALLLEFRPVETPHQFTREFNSPAVIHRSVEWRVGCRVLLAGI